MTQTDPVTRLANPGRVTAVHPTRERITRYDLARERVWEWLDAQPIGAVFYTHDAWLATKVLPWQHYTLTHQVLSLAADLGYLVREGRDNTRQGCPMRYRKVK